MGMNVRDFLRGTSALHRRQLGWYLHNVFQSEARDDLLCVLREHLETIGDFRFGDEEQGRKRPQWKDFPPPPPDTPDHTNWLAVIERATSSFAQEPESEEFFQPAVKFVARLFSLQPVEVQILVALLRSVRNNGLRDLGNGIYRIIDFVPYTLAALLAVSIDAIEACLEPSGTLLSSGLVRSHGEHTSFLFGSRSDLYIDDRFRKLLLAPLLDEQAFVQAIAGRPVPPCLTWDDFGHLGEAADMAAKLLQGAVHASEQAIHILLMGPPGTGKTEFAAVVAQRAGLQLYSVGESDESGEPDRSSRLSALQRAHAVLATCRDSVILLDEAEDVLEGRDVHRESRSEMSKAFLNRLLETSRVPTIWTTNSVYAMDLATVRRMSLVIKIDVPDEPARERIWTRILQQEGLACADGAARRLAKRWTAPAAAASIAARTARLASAGEAGLDVALGGVMAVLGRDRALAAPEPKVEVAFDPELTRCAEDLESLCRTLARPEVLREWSMCLSGPPGTGKSAFARYLAKRIGLPVLQKRASDLLSMWVGGSEQNIASAFAEAQRDNALLLVDEAEALLFDRGAGVRSFELSQVNEMLTWMERHPLPFVCTTNLPERMDHAVPRRFTFKLHFEPLSQAQAALAFRRMFECEPLDRLPDDLTPGDFAVVRHKARILGAGRDAARLVEWLTEEADVRNAKRVPMGFR